MATVYGTEAYAVLQEKRIQSIKEGVRRGPITAAKYMTAMARKLAPHKTGNLLGHIRQNRNVVTIGGTNSINGFPYVHWINQTEGYKDLTVLKFTDSTGIGHVNINGSWVPVKGNVMTYGSRPSNWHWTGTPGFVTVARNSARQFFKKTMLEDLRKSIRLNG